MPYIGNQPGTGVRNRFIYTATASQTTFSGADNNGKTLKYADSDFVDVFLNGVCLVPVTDYTSTSKTSIVLIQAASLNDTLEVIAYDIATISDTVSKADGGTFNGDLGITNASPDITLTNNTAEDTDGGRESTLTFKGLQSGGEESTLAEIRASHDATADDQKGDLIFKTNDGSDGASPTERIRIDSGGNFLIGKSAVHEFDAYGTAIMMQLESSGTSPYAGFGMVQNSNDTDSAPLIFGKSRGTSAAATTIVQDGDLLGRIEFQGMDGADLETGASIFGVVDGTPGSNDMPGRLVFNTTADGAHSATERMRIDSTGKVVVGSTATTFNADAKIVLSPNSDSIITNNGQCLSLNRTSTDGDILVFYKDQSGVGSIGSINGAYLFIGDVGGVGMSFISDRIRPSSDGADADDTYDIGHPTVRWGTIYAATGSIQTSDENEKQNIASLTSAEITAATAISKLFKTFKFKSKVTAKGDDARTHTGVIAQQVQTAMSDAGLDASKYAFWCSNTWWEADEKYTDDDGKEQTRTNIFDTKDEAPEGATERTRLGLRYAELLAFIGAATEQRLTSIESRLTALEAG